MNPIVELFAKSLSDFDVVSEVDDYEFRGDDEGGCYTPNEKDRVLLTDFAYGMLNSIQEATRAIPESEIAAVAGEPVAWWRYEGEFDDKFEKGWFQTIKPKNNGIPLYAAPVAPEGMVMVPRDRLRKYELMFSVASTSGIVANDEHGIETPNATICKDASNEIEAMLAACGEEK